MAVTAGENTSTVEDRHAPTATHYRAKKPGAFTTKVTGRPIQVHRIAFIFPVFAAAAVAIGENDPVRLGAYPN